jgi:SAM-dependent methyltransferase
LKLKRADTRKEEARSIIRSYIEQTRHPDLQIYGRSLQEAIRAGADGRYFWGVEHLMALGKLYRRRVLEIGSGFGWDAIALTVLGNNQVVALDVRESMTRPLDEFLSTLRSRGRDLRLTTITGDICGIDIEPESFDAVYSREAIEHIRDLDAMFKECRRLLRPGGSFVLETDSNALNSRLRKETQEMWEKRDNSKAYNEELKRERPIENQGITPYAAMRAKIIREANPTLEKVQVEMLARVTAGMMQAEIRDLSIGFRPGITLPVRPRFSWCRDPVTGEYCERLLDPFELRELAASNGLRGRLYHTYRRFPQRLLNGIQFHPLVDFLFNIRSEFVLAGERVE